MSGIIPLTDRFWQKVNRNGPNDCWLWTGSLMTSGYGTIQEGMIHGVPGRRWGAHRLSWTIHHGPIPDGQWVLHKECDNKRCVNPTHLYLGDNRRNVLDAQERGQKPIGSRCSFSKLNPDEVLQIRVLRDAGWTQARLASAFNVSRATIIRALYGKAYRDVPRIIPYKSFKILHRSHLTEDDIRAVRSASREFSNKALAARYGVGATTIHNIRVGQTWQQVQ